MGMEVLQFTEASDTVQLAELTKVPGRYTNVVPHTPGIVARAYRTYRNFGYGNECRTELTEVPGTGMNVAQNLQKSRCG